MGKRLICVLIFIIVIIFLIKDVIWLDSLLAGNKQQIHNTEDNLNKPFIPLDGFLGINGSISGTGSGSSQLSIRNVRGTPSWADVEKVKGKYDFTSFDKQHNLAQQYNEKLYIGFSSNNLLYGNVDHVNRAILDKTAISAHLKFVSAVAERYKGYGYMYSFWNEPNVPDQDHYGEYPEIYVNMAKDIYKVIKEKDPTAIVCMPDLAARFNTEWFTKICELGILNYTDIISLHLYEGPPENLIKDIHKYRTTIRKFTSSDIPIYITEFGWSSAPGIPYEGTNVDEETRSKYVLRYLLLALELNIRKVFIYTTRTQRTDDTNKEHWYGIYDTDDNWTKLPIANTLLNFMRENINYCYIGREFYSNKNDYIMKFMNLETNSIRYIVWTTEDNHTILLPTGELVELTDTVQTIDADKDLDVFDFINSEKHDNYSESVKRLSNYIKRRMDFKHLIQ
jgi:hypothetical protein